MRDIPYGEFGSYDARVRAADPAVVDAQEAATAFALAHEADVAAIAESLDAQQSVLVTGDKALLALLREEITTLQARRNRPRLREVTTSAGAGRHVVSRLAGKLAVELRDAYTATPREAVFIAHLDLMAWSLPDQPRGELNDIVYWLHEYRGVTKLAFWDPLFNLPQALKDLFPRRVSLQYYGREVMPRLLSKHEARALCPDAANFTIAAQLALYQYLSGSNVVDVRRILRTVVDATTSEHPSDELLSARLRRIHELARRGGAGEIPMAGEVTGYDRIRDRLKRTVLIPFDARHCARTKAELELADRLIPQGIILHGPPGTGKTEWAKWLAAEMRATVFALSGSELLSKFVGETEAAIRRVFAMARRAAPSVIVIDEIDVMLVRRSDQSGLHANSMVAQLLTEMDGLGGAAAVLVVGTTNARDNIDPAFLRTGRFGHMIEIGLPDPADRRAILKHHAAAYGLSELEPRSFDRLVENTDRMSGDDLRGVCRHLAGEKLAARGRDTTFSVNAIPSLRDAIEAVGGTIRDDGIRPSGASPI